MAVGGHDEVGVSEVLVARHQPTHHRVRVVQPHAVDVGEHHVHAPPEDGKQCVHLAHAERAEAGEVAADVPRHLLLRLHAAVAVEALGVAPAEDLGVHGGDEDG